MSETYYDPDRKIFWSNSFRISEKLMIEERGEVWVNEYKEVITHKKCDI